MNKSRSFSMLAAVIATSYVAQAARASLVTWEFAGEVTFVRDGDDLLGGAVTVGSPFHASMTFDPTISDADPGNAIGLYPLAIVDVFGTIGPVSFEGPTGRPNAIDVQNTTGLDFLRAQAGTDFASYPLDFGLLLLDNSGDVLSGDFLPIGPPNLALFDMPLFILGDGTEQLDISIQGRVSSLVPEPATFLLLTMGGLFVIRRTPREGTRRFRCCRSRESDRTHVPSGRRHRSAFRTSCPGGDRLQELQGQR